ncbi:MAG: PKD domain-containing protein, partial [Thermoplasmata archaeon]
TVTDDNGDSGTYTVYVTVLNIAPLANAGWIQSVFEDETVYFIGTGFDTVSDQSSLVYEWDFGDGNTGSGENPTHVYTTSGAYTVCLTVTDDDGDYSKDHVTIKVENIPPTADAGSDISVIEDTTISFSGAGYDTASDISSLTYSWDFGDGSSVSGPSPNHVYSKSGLYIVTLIVTDDDGITSQDTLTVTVNNDAPTADSGLDMTVNEDDMVAFSGIGDDTSTDSAILKYNWEFDDIAEPTSCNGKSAWHRFESLGKYYVTLTVEDDDLATASDVVEVTVNNVAPTAYAGPDLFIFAGVFPLQFAGVGFDTPSDEPYLTYHWDFGEGSTSDLRNPIHYYTRDGTYTVTLTVTDDDLDYGVDYATIEVLIDSDGDGMPDSWEIQYGLDPYDPTGENGAEGDPDGDDLYNIYEFWADTIPIDEDTDNDSFHDNFWDGVEVFYWIDEGYSLAEAGAKANTWDCDTDGMPDGWEYHYLPELDPDDGTGQYGASGDPDGDSLLNINEYYAGTDPTDEDTDDDYFFDGDEVTCGSNPLDWDSDDDGLLDGDADERDADSDGDGTINSWEPDSDNDYLKDGLERGLSAPQSPYNDPDKDPFISLSGTVSSQFVADGDSGATTTDPTDDDSDDDGIIDGNEDSNRNGVRDGGVIAGTDTVSDYTSGGETDPNNANTDGDYLLDGLEIGLAIPQGLHTDTSVYRADTHTASTTDPLDADTDDDGLDDGEEDANQNGYVNSNEPDPNNPDTDGDGIKDGDNNDLIILTLESIANVDPLSSHTFTLLINDGGSVPGYETSPHIISPASIKNNINEDIAVAFYIFNLPIQVKMDGVVIATLFVTTDGSGTVIEFPNSLLVSFSSRIEKYSFSDPNAVDMDQDADNDGIDDYPEVIYYSGRCRDFRYEDTDGDKNYVFETLIDGTTIYHNIIDPDSDNDEIPDGWEIYYDLDPLNYADAYEDPDYDDLVNKEEYLLGTHPFNWDTDTDYMQDGWEIRYGFKPLDQTDAANDPDKDGLTNLEEFQKVLHPKNSDTDGDGLWDGWHDDNNNGALDTTEVKGEKQHSTNPRKWDTDSDRLCDKDEVDGWYVTVVTSSTTTYHVTSDPLVKDTDGDGLSDFHEEQHSADPQKSDTDSDGLGDNDEVGKYNTDPSKSVTYTRSDTTVASFLDDVQSDAGGEFRDPPCPYAGGAVENVYIEEVKITAPAGANDPFSPTDPGWYEIFTAHVYQENTANTQVSITLKSYNDGNPTSIDNEDIFNNIELKDINGNTIDTNVDSSTDYKGEITVTSTNALAKGDYELFWETDFDDDASGVTSTLYITSNLPIVFVCPDPVLGTFPTEIIFQNTVETKYLYFRGHVHDGGYINNLKLDSTSTISTSTTSGNHLYEDSEFVFFLDPDTDVDLNDEESKVSVGQHTITFDWVVTHNLAEMQFHICTHGWKDPNQHDMDDDLLTDYEEGDVGTNPENPDTDGDAMLDGYEEECGVSNGGWQNPTVHNDRYAVLYVGGVRSGGNHPRYWNQLVDIYDVLLDDYRYTAQNVFVFYADGNTPDNNNCNNPGACNAINTHTTMIDDDATDATITTFLDTTLENTLTDPNDFLYVWFYDHGDDANVPDASVMCWGNGLLDDHEVEDWLADYTCARIAVTMGTCYCGGFIDPGLLSAGSTQAAGDVDANRNINDLAGDVLISMSQDYRVSHSQSTRGFVYHHQVALNPATGDVMLGTATYTNGAFSGVSPDSDGNGFVSLREAYIYAEANDDYTAANHATLDDRPQYWDSHATVGNLGSTTYL